MSENCNCGHHHDHEERPLSKYEQALSKYRTNISDDEVRNAVRQIIAEKVHENDTTEVKKFLMGSVELTTLKTTDSEDSVLAFTEKVNKFDETYPDLPHVATICVYPCFAKTVSESVLIMAAVAADTGLPVMPSEAAIVATLNGRSGLIFEFVAISEIIGNSE